MVVPAGPQLFEAYTSLDIGSARHFLISSESDLERFKVDLDGELFSTRLDQ